MKILKPQKKKLEKIPEHRQNFLPCAWIGGIKVVKRTILPKTMYSFNAMLIKISLQFIYRNWKKTFKFHWKYEQARLAKMILNNKIKIARGNTILKCQVLAHSLHQ